MVLKSKYLKTTKQIRLLAERRGQSWKQYSKKLEALLYIIYIYILDWSLIEQKSFRNDQHNQGNC